VKPALVDTDILSMFFRGNRTVVSCFEIYLNEHRQINFSIVTYYEILSGLKHRDAQKQLTLFLEFAAQNLRRASNRRVSHRLRRYLRYPAKGRNPCR
jgi:tRNA(fMet)-specific endonuclease VapC